MMDQFNYHYKVYIDKCIALAHTAIVKSAKDAKDMNDLVRVRARNLNAVDVNNPSSWIYYRHVSGEYHPTDQPIYVTSVDTTERIVFSKANLLLHKNTKKEYAYGTHKYEMLIERYPNKELLIKGILNPVNIDFAINAKDGTLLSYDGRFVESNEYTLIEKIQDFIYGLFDRWYQKQYNIDNRHYNKTFMGIVYQKIVEAVMEIRMSHCLTNEAHSYHYRQFLASHGFLDFYIDHLSIQQCLILYKNIRWVERYIGQRHTQQWLIKHIMTLRNFPVSEYNMIQVYKAIDQEVKARAMFERVSLNGLEYIDNAVDTLNLKQMLDKEDPLAPFNLREREFEEKDAKELTAESLSSELKTKILESRITDYTDSETVTLPNVLMDNWIELVYRKQYRAYISITHPISGEIIPLSGLNALLLFTYATFQVNKINDNCIPDFLVGMVPRLKRPTRQEIVGLFPNPSIVLTSWVDKLLLEYQALVPIISTIDFYQQSVDAFNRLNRALDLAKKDEHLDATTYKMVAIYRLYSSRIVSFRTKQMSLFTQFLEQISFDTKNMKTIDYEAIAKSIWMKATGLDGVNVKTIANTSQAMVALLSKLSSYSVHYIREINESPIKATAFRALRLDGDGYKVGKHEVKDFGNFAIEIVDDDTISKTIVKDQNEWDHSVKIQDGESIPKITFDIDPSVYQINLNTPIRINSDSDVPTGISSWVIGDKIEGLENPLSLPPLPGMATWLQLPNDIKKLVLDQFGTNLNWSEHEVDKREPMEDINFIIRNDDLPGFTYHDKKP